MGSGPSGSAPKVNLPALGINPEEQAKIRVRLADSFFSLPFALFCPESVLIYA